MATDNRVLRPRRLVLLLSLVVAWMPLPAQAGHDQDEDDLTYFLPTPPERAKRLLDGGETVVFIDLREPEDFKRARLPGARSIPLRELTAQYEKVPKSGRVVLYCACAVGNIEEGFAYQTLRNFGYRNVSVLEGGFSEWRRLGYPVETEPRS
jgi:rhodanese-related sulfurtransferase